jgi:hypothetical protein
MCADVFRNVDWHFVVFFEMTFFDFLHIKTKSPKSKNFRNSSQKSWYIIKELATFTIISVVQLVPVPYVTYEKVNIMFRSIKIFIYFMRLSL